MKQGHRYFLLSPEGDFLIRSTGGSVVSLSNAVEFAKYTGDTFPPDIFEVSYEPTVNINHVGRSGEATVIDFEKYIDMIPEILEKKENKFFGLSAEENIFLQKADKRADAYNKYTVDSKATVTVEGIEYNGGQDSASAISGAVSLANRLGESSVMIAAYDNKARECTFAEALNIAAQIGKAWRASYFVLQATKVEIEEDTYEVI